MSIFDDIRRDREAGTPGPWHVGPVDDTRVETGDGECVAEIDGDYNHPDTWPMMEANARRIARVPELERIALAAEELADAARKFRDFAQDHAEHNEVMPKTITMDGKRLDAALAKLREATA